MTATATVREIALPRAARALTTLPQLDYHDTFVFDLPRTEDRTAEQWARAMLEGASDATRAGLRAGWLALGLKLGPEEAKDRVLGWEVRRSTPEVLILSGESHLGMRGELLFQRRKRTLLFATFLVHTNDVARTVWAGAAPMHRKIVRRLLEQAVRRAGDTPD